MTQHLNSVQKQRILCKENIWHCLFHALLLDKPSIQNTVRFQCRFQSCSYYFLTTSICSGKRRPNFFPCFKKNDIALGFKVVSDYGFQSYGYVFPISLAKNQTQHGFELSPLYLLTLSTTYTLDSSLSTHALVSSPENSLKAWDYQWLVPLYSMLPLKVAKPWLAICLPIKSPQSSELNLVAVPWLRQVTVSFLSYGCKVVAEQASFTIQFNLNKFTFNFKEERMGLDRLPVFS